MITFKERKLFSKIINFMEDETVIVIHGARQVGKTTLLQYIIQNHLKNLTYDNNIFYFDLEDFEFLKLCNTSVDNVMKYVEQRGADHGKIIFILIDEIQYLSHPSSFIKLFHDRYKGKVKLIVSGSSSFLIKRKFKNSLVGRIVDFELFPLDFEEFLLFKNKQYDLTKISDIDIVNRELSELYKEFVIFGGYPAIVLENNINKKETYIKQIINTYIRKDIRDLADIRNIDKFNDLIRVLASQTSNLVNMFELSSTLGIARATLEEYIFLLENTYIVRRVAPFHLNVRSELSKMRKIFFEDTGLANILINKSFSTLIEGNLLETSVYNELRKNFFQEDIYYWRTAKKQEIDFIFDFVNKKRQKKTAAIEVKNKFLNKYTTHLKYFKNTYKETESYFCCMEKIERNKNKDINIIRPWQIIKTFSAF